MYFDHPEPPLPPFLILMETFHPCFLPTLKTPHFSSRALLNRTSVRTELSQACTPHTATSSHMRYLALEMWLMESRSRVLNCIAFKLLKYASK